MNKREINETTSIYPTLPSLLFIVFLLENDQRRIFFMFFCLSLVIFFKNRVLNNIGDYK